MSVFVIYCDGACRKKNIHHSTGNGSYAYMIVDSDNKSIISSGGEQRFGVTNNQMELLGCVNGLKSLLMRNGDTPHISCEVISDSKYLVDNAVENMYEWQKRGWKNSSNKPIKNVDIWKDLFNTLNSFDTVKFTWVKGHSDNHLNNIVDEMCNTLLDANKLIK